MGGKSRIQIIGSWSQGMNGRQTDTCRRAIPKHISVRWQIKIYIHKISVNAYKESGEPVLSYKQKYLLGWKLWKENKSIFYHNCKFIHINANL